MLLLLKFSLGSSLQKFLLKFILTKWRNTDPGRAHNQRRFYEVEAKKKNTESQEVMQIIYWN